MVIFCNHKSSGRYADFESNKVHLLKILLNNTKKFIKQKDLRILFYPKNTPWHDSLSQQDISYLLLQLKALTFPCVYCLQHDPPLLVSYNIICDQNYQKKKQYCSDFPADICFCFSPRPILINLIVRNWLQGKCKISLDQTWKN